jgi:general secretion pathway protein G
MCKRRRSERGFTLAEMVMVAALIALLAGMALPVAKFNVKRQKEAELRLALRTMRNAIDEYKRLSDQGMIPMKLGSEGYPLDLETLVEGVEVVGQPVKRKFLRRIPRDPMLKEEVDEDEPGWLLISYQDEPDTDSWGGENVYDVRSMSDGTAIDGTKYRDW